MSRPSPPHVADLEWSNWIRTFPRRAVSDRYDLAEMESRLAKHLERLPDTGRLSANEKVLLQDWLEDYGYEFDFEQEEPVRVFEVTDLVNLGTIAIGLAAASFIPPITIGALVVSGGLWSRKIQRSFDTKQKKAIVAQIKRLLREIGRKVR